MTRQERIDEAIDACTECGRAGFPKRHDCDSCTAAVDEAMVAESAAEGDRIAAITREIAAHR